MKKWLSWVIFLVIIVSLLGLSRKYFWDVVVVHSYSMYPTLKQGDWIFLIKAKELNRGDIIVFREKEGTKYFIKRVIAKMGDNIRIEGEKIMLNGKVLIRKELQLNESRPARLQQFKFIVYEEFLEEKAYMIAIDADRIYQSDLKVIEKIAPNSFYVMGDNRNFSKDSREFGEIFSGDIIGKVIGIFSL